MNSETPTKRLRALTPNNKTTTGFRISDELWKVFEPLLPKRVNTHRYARGGKRLAQIQPTVAKTA
jgi:putative transposase